MPQESLLTFYRCFSEQPKKSSLCSYGAFSCTEAHVAYLTMFEPNWIKVIRNNPLYLTGKPDFKVTREKSASFFYSVKNHVLERMRVLLSYLSLSYITYMLLQSLKMGQPPGWRFLVTHAVFIDSSQENRFLVRK